MDPRLNQAGPTLIILAEHKEPVYDKSGITLITSAVRRFPPEGLGLDALGVAGPQQKSGRKPK